MINIAFVNGNGSMQCLVVKTRWFDSHPRSGGLSTDDAKDTEKEGFGDGSDVHRFKPQAVCATTARRFRSSFIRPDPEAPRVGFCRLAEFPVGCAVPRTVGLPWKKNCPQAAPMDADGEKLGDVAIGTG